MLGCAAMQVELDWFFNFLQHSGFLRRTLGGDYLFE